MAATATWAAAMAAAARAALAIWIAISDMMISFEVGINEF